MTTEKDKTAAKKECFIIAPIDGPNTETRKRLEYLVKHIIVPAVDKNYFVTPPHQINKPGRITMQVIEKLVTAPLVIADLSDHNANVYYELSLRHALNAPTILMVEEKQKNEIPFDLHGHNYIDYELSDLDKVDHTKNMLKDQADNLAKKWPETSNVISEKLTLVPSPEGPHDHSVLLSSLLFANRFRHELIEPYFESTRYSVEERNDRLRNVFGMLMWQSAQTKLMKKETTLEVFKNRDLRKEVENLFEEVNPIIMQLSTAINGGDEEDITAQLKLWRDNNTRFIAAWAKQYQEYVNEHLV